MHTEMFFYIGLLVVPEVYGEWVKQRIRTPTGIHLIWHT